MKNWKTVRVAATTFHCEHCGAVGATERRLTVQGFMRKLRAFEAAHNRCAPAAWAKACKESAADVLAALAKV